MVQHVMVTSHSTASRHAIYELLKDPATWTSWSGMDDVRLEAPAPEGDPLGVGSIRALDRGRIHGLDQVVELVPDQRFSYVHLSGLPVRDYRADVDLETVDGGTRITWQASFRPKYAGTGPIWRKGIAKMLQQMADSVGAVAETPRLRPTA